jgi:hypothetical protein
MRHFLWFYVQVMTSDVEAEERPRKSAAKGSGAAVSKETAFIEKLKHPTDAAMLRYYADSKTRKPN